MVSFVSFASISALIFKISFLPLTLGSFLSSFSSCFRCRVRLFIWLFSCFLRYACIGMNLLLRTALTVSHRIWAPHVKNWLIGKDSDAGRDWGQEEKGTTEDEMAGWHHRLDRRQFEWTPGVGDGQGGLACCDSWGRKESDTTERLNWTGGESHLFKQSALSDFSNWNNYFYPQAWSQFRQDGL